MICFKRASGVGVQMFSSNPLSLFENLFRCPQIFDLSEKFIELF